MFSGLRSRCTTPWAWAPRNARAICSPIATARGGRHAADARQLLAQRLPLEELRRDERLPVEVADVVEPHGVRVLDRRREVHLLHEAIDDVPFARELAVDQLERDLAVHGVLDGRVDDAHAAAAEHGCHRVATARDRSPDQGIRAVSVAVRGHGARLSQAATTRRPRTVHLAPSEPQSIRSKPPSGYSQVGISKTPGGPAAHPSPLKPPSTIATS